MFYAFNSKKFGNELKQLRKKLGYTQLEVSTNIKLSIDGLRKIENGYVTPKFETLIKLSGLYKYDLIDIMKSNSKISNLVDAYKEIQRYIDTEDKENISELIVKLISSSDYYLSNGLILIEDLNQFIEFCKASLLYIENTKNSLLQSKVIIIKALKLTIYDFELKEFHKFHYNHFEIRYLNLLAFVERRLNNHNQSIELLKFLLKDSVVNTNDVQSIKNIILINFNLSYSYNEISDYKNALKYAENGIEFSLNHLRLCELHLLYYRKGIAEYFLDIETYHDSLKKSIFLLEIQNSPLANLYKKITKDTYGIEID